MVVTDEIQDYLRDHKSFDVNGSVSSLYSSNFKVYFNILNSKIKSTHIIDLCVVDIKTIV